MGGTFSSELPKPQEKTRDCRRRLRSQNSSKTMYTSSKITGRLVSNETLALTFHLFDKLPLELQLMVWEFAVEVVTPPRVIKPLVSSKNDKIIYTTAKVPALLHACSEARKIALKTYELTFDHWIAKFESNITPRIYFNFKRDFLYECLPSRCTCVSEVCAHYLLRSVANDRVERLAIECFCVPDWFGIEMWHNNLRELMVVDMDQVMTGGWAWLTDFENVDETTTAAAGDTERMLLKKREEQRRMCEIDFPEYTSKWSIERTWKVRHIVNLTNE